MIIGMFWINKDYLQVQKDFPTVEGELFKAMARCRYISENDILSPVRFAFQRAARTDRSVSAARQVQFSFVCLLFIFAIKEFFRLLNLKSFFSKI